MKIKLLSLIGLVGILASLAFLPPTTGPARSIQTVSTNPLACKEADIFYNTISHQFLVCSPSANTLSTVSFGGGGGGVGITFLNGLTGSTQVFTVGTSGTNFNIS